jgi:hypothetical protein
MGCYKQPIVDGHGEADLNLIMDENQLITLSIILQQGFLLKTQVGCSMKRFLIEGIGLRPEYIAERIQTIFLDGSPVDDLDSAIIKDGSHLALSAAMPGLVGAAMRRGGVYSSLRNSITYQETGEQGILKQGSVFIKLFNLLMKDLGPYFLKKGIFIPSPDLAEYFSRQTESFWKGCKGIFFNGKPLVKDVLLKGKILLPYALIHISVRAES